MIFRSLLGQAAPQNAPRGDEETFESGPLGTPSSLVHALHVIGPSGGARFALPAGIVTLGRDPASTVVLEDRRASRQHAIVSVGAALSVSDLGSANGTFVDGERLAPHEPRTLALGQSFRIGSSHLLVDVAPLARRSVKRVESFAALSAQLAGLPPDARRGRGVSVVRVRTRRGTRALPVEAVLDSALGPDDWMLRTSEDTLLAGVVEAADGETVAERTVLRALLEWGIAAELDARFVDWCELADAQSDLRALLAFEAPRRLERGRIVVLDPAMKELERTILRVARANINVLVLGETGAGKDVAASMLHELSARARQPFIGLNCATLPDQLLESELFGHERGAFTGAVCAKAGLIEAADGGTLFLDEIGDLPAPLQAKLLRMIESRELMRLGAVKPRPVDVRFVAATHRDLEEEVLAGRFRRDLYYRLNGIVLRVPPLRDRRSEIEPLARLFHASACERFEVPVVPFSTRALETLVAYAWPGNVRELKNAVERAVLVADDVIEPEHLGLADGTPCERRAALPTDLSELGADAPTERDRITRALEACAGNQSRAAQVLNMPRRTLVRKIAQLGLPRPRF
ncbi:MAG TPA: sigma 54-interacting transcriptional regulator [Polyangiaceae bacterium]|nr:sigma 54-interacting transcriptional regulator [Polyangiaceae bacterium]